MEQVIYSSSRVIVEYKGLWYELRIDRLPDGKFACYHYKFGAIPYLGDSQDEVIRKYLDDNTTAGVPAGSFTLK